MKLPAAAGLLLALGACAPAVTHGPRVEPGLYIGGTLGVIAASDTAAAPDVLTPNWGSFARYGTRLGDEGWAGSLAIATSGEQRSGVEGDAYLQLPSRDSLWVYGAGVIGSRAYAMPYAQLGRPMGRGYEVYTTQGFVWRGDFTEKRQDLDGGDAEVRPRYWMPAVALARRDRYGAVSAEVAGALGRFDERVTDPATGATRTTGRPLRAFTVRFTGEFDVMSVLHLLGSIAGQPVPRRAPPPR